jgi:NAD(P)-dependent dehydrogenase (short-subunit alcohol dehydrogenase family)
MTITRGFGENPGSRPTEMSTGDASIVSRLDDADLDAVWLVTGAANGLGRSLALSALNCLRRVVVTSNRLQNLLGLAREYGSQLTQIEMDVNDELEDRVAVDRVMESFGRIDVVVNNAGFDDDWDSNASHATVLERVQANLFGALWTSQSAIAYMKSAGRGQIVLVFALTEIDRYLNPELFDWAKRAFEGFGESLARETAPFGLQIAIAVPRDVSCRWTAGSSDEPYAILPLG